MKPSRAFWGTFFISFGLLFLIARNYDVNFGWEYIWKLWPLAFVFIGLAVMIKNPRMKWVLAAVSALGIALLAYGALSFAWLDSIHWERDGEEVEGTEVQDFSEPITPNITTAHFTLDAAAGKYRIDSSTQELFQATTRSVPGRYTLERESTGDRVDLHLKMKGNVKFHGWRFGRFTNQADIKLNTTPSWDCEFNVGAANVDFDLSPYKIENLQLEAGAATVRIKLGMAASETRVKIEVGASTFKISVPEGAGCEVKIDGGLSSKKLEDFEKVNEHTYRTENFDKAAKKIFIDVESGVSSIRVSRY